MNARLVFWHNDGWVKLTLKPGQRVELKSGGPTDEGYSYTYEVYEYIGDKIFYEYVNEACDCDGPLSRFGQYECDIIQSKDEERDEFGNLLRHRPQWNRLSCRQRDAYAEAMNY
jgi:hypothetical protein